VNCYAPTGVNESVLAHTTREGLRFCPPRMNETSASDPCLPAAHPLASRRSLVEGDLSAESVLDTETRRTASVEEKFELVAAGRGIAVLPRSVAQYYSRPGPTWSACRSPTRPPTSSASP
jgi:DNA-binding transcriptional LysR family regulator